MALETGSYIGDLNPANPPGTDPKSQGDDHLRLVKLSLRNCFAGFSGAICVTGVDGGASNNYTLTTSPPVVAYTPRMMCVFSPVAVNNGPATLNVSSLGVKNLRSVTGGALIANDLALGNLYVAMYTGTEWRLISSTENYINQLTFNAVLPAQPGGNAAYELTTQNNIASWTPRPAAVSLAAYKLGAL